jgi:hypothetical protein
MSENWKLEGTYFESCNCEVACPCVFLNSPTEEECTVIVGWHIKNGKYEGISLNDLNVAIAVNSPGHMAQVKWNAALYFDNKASEEQKTALTQIFTGQVGGHPARLVSHVGNVLGLKTVPIQYNENGKHRSLKISNLADIEIEAIEGQGGAEVTIENHPLCIAPGYPAVVAKSKKLNFKDYNLDLEISGKNGFYSSFTYQPN